MLNVKLNCLRVILLLSIGISFLTGFSNFGNLDNSSGSSQKAPIFLSYVVQCKQISDFRGFGRDFFCVKEFVKRFFSFDFCFNFISNQLPPDHGDVSQSRSTVHFIGFSICKTLSSPYLN